MPIPFVRLAALYFAYFGFVGAFMPYFGLYLAWLGLAPWAIGSLLAVGQTTRVFAPNLWAWWADRRGRSIGLLRLALGFSVLSFAGLFVARDFFMLLLVLAAHSFFVSAAMPLFESLTLGHLHGQYNRYGAIRLWGSVGFIASVLILGWGLDRVGISNLIWMVLLPLAGAALCSLLIYPAATVVQQDGESIRAIVKRPEVIGLLSAGFLMCVAHGPLYAFYSIYLDEAGYSKTAVGALWSLGVIAEIIVFLAMPRWLNRFSPRAILLVSFGLATIRFLMIGWGVESLATLIIAQVLHAASFGSFHAAALAVINEWFQGPRHVRGQALFSSLTYGAGSAVGSLLAGALWQSVGPQWTYTAASFAAACGLLLLLWRGRALPRVGLAPNLPNE
ncbi:MAG TPA: MFS transporter [Burkholderiales bacterium]|nr:MFS transporter [Burkholderiales bacterium]